MFLLLVLMVFGWRARKRRQSHLVAPEVAPTDLGRVFATFDAFYVATTMVGEPLNRVAVHGLGFRSRAVVTVSEGGIVLDLRGQDGAFIPLSALRGVTRATWTIDRVVEEGGLVMVSWQLGEQLVDSYLRLDQSQELIDAIEQISPTEGEA